MQSMDEIYRKYAQLVYKYLLSLTGNETIAEEVTQETFYQAIKSIERFDGSCKVSTWLCAIAQNQLKVYLRRNKAYDEPDEASAAVPSSEELFDRKQEKLLLMRALHAVEDPYREVLYLRMYGGLSFREIGEVTGHTENWARVTFYRAKEMVRKELESYE